MKKLLPIIIGLIFCATSLFAQQTDEELREEIRKEVREEIRKQEEIKTLEQRKAKIREEEMAREKLKTQIREEEMAREKNTTEKKAQDSRNARRLKGWSISAHFGANFPLGKLVSQNLSSGHFATTGIAVSLNNSIQFTKVIGLHLGLGYDKNPVDGVGISEAIRKDQNLPSDVEFRGRTVPFEQYTVRLGPVIRALGSVMAFHFRPYIGINIINGGSYFVDLYQGNYLGTVSLTRKTTGAFLTGTAIDFSFHVAKHSDIVVGLELNMVWRSVFYEVRSSSGTTSFGSEDMELIRLAPMIGYRFHL